MAVRNSVQGATPGQPVSLVEENAFRQEVVDEFTSQQSAINQNASATSTAQADAANALNAAQAAQADATAAAQAAADNASEISSNDAEILQLQNDLAALSVPIFGQNYAYAEDLDVEVSTTTGWTEKLTLSVNLPAGVFRLGWTYQWNSDNTGADFRARVQLNNNTVIFEHRQEPKDSAGAFGSPATGTNQQHTAASFEHITLAAPASLQIDLDWAAAFNGIRASIWNAKLELWRVQ